MEEAGVIIDRDGNDYPFGNVNDEEFIKQIKTHNSTFLSEIATLPEFKKLNLIFNETDTFVTKCIKLAFQGIITIQNVSNINTAIVFLPNNLTDRQYDKLLEYYEKLNNFENQIIAMYNSLNEKPKMYHNIDEYLEVCMQTRSALK